MVAVTVRYISDLMMVVVVVVRSDWREHIFSMSTYKKCTNNRIENKFI